MANYAVITNGIVTNVYVANEPMEIGDILVTSAGIGWAYANGVFSAPTVNIPTPSTAQLAMNALYNGVTITSLSTPAINATYACDSQTTGDINAEITSIMLNGVFADGLSTIQWPDAVGGLHTFSITQFKTFATALAAFVSGIRKYATGVIPSLPSNQITIA